MSLQYVLLTVLAQGDATGYEITKEFDVMLGYFWHASHQHVYRELRSLEDAGMVRHQVVPQEGKPDRKVYSITQEGRAALAEWVDQPLKPRRVNDELLVRILAAGVVGVAPLKREMAAQRESHQRRLETYEEIEREHFSSPTELPESLRLAYLTLRGGILRERAFLAWLDEVDPVLAGFE